MMYTVGVLALTLAGAMFTLSVRDWHDAASGTVDLQDYRSAVQRFREGIAASASAPVDVSPLIVEAQVFAQHLNPPKEPEKLTLPLSSPVVNSAPSAPAVRPAAPSVRFRVHGICCYPNQPGRSMALISEVGSPVGSERWVKEGAKLGHFVVHEIRQGVLVYRDGEQLREMAAETGASLPGIVQDIRPGGRKVSAATDVAEPVSAAGPNSIETGGQ